MNPLASAKCAGRLLMALAAISVLLLAVGCTSSNSTSTNKQGFTNSSFNGIYVISIQGTDVNLGTSGVVPLAIMGTLQPNGSGGFNTAGSALDIIDPGNTGINQGVTIGTSSAYSVGSDGRGSATLVTNVASVGTLDIDFVLSSTNGGLISLFNTSTIPATGSGTIDLQTATSQSALTSLAFSLYGGDSNGTPLATVGAFSLNSSGVIQTGGTQDINDNNSSAASNGTTGIAITGGNVTLNSAGTAGTATLTNASSNSSFNSLALNVWVISPTQLKFDETDGINVLSGDAFAQASFPTGQIVFTLAGQDNAADPFVAGGSATAAAGGGLSSGLEDFNNTATSNTSVGFSATPTATNSSGRIQLATTGFTNVTGSNLQFAAYPSSGGVLLLEDDSAGLAVGGAFPQSASALNASGGYALNLTGENDLGPVTPVGEVDNIGQFDPGAPDTTSTSTTINMTGNLDENDLGVSPPMTGSLNGAYVPDTSSDGSGSILATNGNTLLGGFTLRYYVVDSSTVLFIEIDSVSVLGNGDAQVAAGVFETQTTPTSSATRKAMFIVNPVIISRGAAKTSVARHATKYR